MEENINFASTDFYIFFNHEISSESYFKTFYILKCYTDFGVDYNITYLYWFFVNNNAVSALLTLIFLPFQCYLYRYVNNALQYRFSDLSTVPLSGVWWPPLPSVSRFPWPVRAFQGGPLCSVLLLPCYAWRRISPLLPWLNLLPGSMENLINVIAFL